MISLREGTELMQASHERSSQGLWLLLLETPPPTTVAPPTTLSGFI
jgi:hypothetical protein